MRFNQAFTKLNELCKKYNRPKSSELIKAILKSSLIMPCKTRWNSLFDSITRLLTFDIKLLNKVTEALSLEQISPNDTEFFNEYVTVMGPIAEAIDSLQSDSFYSHFLPTLVNIKYVLESMAAESNLKHCQPLLEAITAGFEKRFGHFFDDCDDKTMAAVMSSCVHSHFKMRWFHEDMHTNNYSTRIENIIVREAIRIEKEPQTATPNEPKEENGPENVKGMVFQFF